MLDPAELDWLDQRMRGGIRHLLVGTSLPFLVAMGLHHFEAWDEALVHGAWGKVGCRIGEKLREAVDLEHWAAFQKGFHDVARMTIEVADGKRGPAPESVTFLSGDVHHSYVAEVDREQGSRILQAVCSPIRNPLPHSMRFATAILSYGMAGPIGAAAARSAKVPDAPFTWRTVEAPWFDNNIATLEDTPAGLKMWWESGVVGDGDQAKPRLEKVATALVAPRPGSVQVWRDESGGGKAVIRVWRSMSRRYPGRGERSRWLR